MCRLSEKILPMLDVSAKPKQYGMISNNFSSSQMYRSIWSFTAIVQKVSFVWYCLRASHAFAALY